MSYSANSAYWQAQANRCRGFADEGACLARIARVAPVTIVPGFAGLGQTPGTTTLPARSPQLMAVQRLLIGLGVLTLRAPDGVISATSPTLAAIQTWATNNGFSATGVARTSSGGLTIPTNLLDALLASSAPAQTTPGQTPATVPSKGGGSGAPAAAAPAATPWPSRTFVIVGGAALALLATALLVGATRK